MTSRLNRFVAVLVAASAVAACGGDDDAAPVDTTAASTSAPSPAAAWPVTIENCGRTLTFDAPPSAVVIDYLPVAETLIALGVQDAVIGRSPYEENVGEPDEFLPGQREAFEAMPEVSDDINLPAKEELLALGPDLVVGYGYGAFNAEAGRASLDDLASAGVQAYIMGDWCSAEDVDAFTIDSVLDDVRDLGAIFGVGDTATALVADLQGRLDTVAAAVAGLEPVPAVLADPSTDVFYALGQGMGTQLLEAAGGTNLFAGADDYAEVSVEEVAAAGAEAYVIVQYLPTTAAERWSVIEDVAPDSPGVVDQHYVVVPAVAIHPGIRNVTAVETIAAALHPDTAG